MAPLNRGLSFGRARTAETRDGRAGSENPLLNCRDYRSGIDQSWRQRQAQALRALHGLNAAGRHCGDRAERAVSSVSSKFLT
jgi:hypothetical protein